MNVQFQKSAYYNTLKSSTNTFNDDNYSKKITLEYEQENLLINDFSDHYSSDGWFLRKIVAIPLAIGGVLKTIFHLVQAIIASINPFSSDKPYYESRLFYIKRDLQEVMGWLISLFDDMKGQFHIQESHFHKTCYDFALENTNLTIHNELDTVNLSPSRLDYLYLNFAKD